jgi:3-deoxy-manno-octulosonate cytidylyltransferase (CMP-KDO synthetase)
MSRGREEANTRLLELEGILGYPKRMEKTRKAPCRPLIIVPARMASTRLPQKPLADIGGEPMIAHVWRRAMESGLGEVVVACDGKEIERVIQRLGGNAVITKPDHPSGSDRIWEALEVWEETHKGEPYDAVINLQGDLPTIEPKAVKAVWDLLADPLVDIGTLAVEIRSEAEKNASHIVKAALDVKPGVKKGRALYFSRVAVPSGEGPLYHHIGIYTYRREALAQFIKAPPAPLELREKLEQLRALALGLRIEAGIIDTAPLGVDTPDDLEKARKLLASK